MANSSGQALDSIKAGKVTDGVAQLKDIIVTTRIPAARQKAVQALSDAIPIIQKVGDQQMTDKKYPDAIATYEQGIRAAMLLSRVHKSDTLIPDADPMMNSINEAAKAVANLQLAEVYLAKTPPDYDTAADLEERGGAPDDQVAKLRAMAKKHRK
jgi:hypothetical protein